MVEPIPTLETCKTPHSEKAGPGSPCGSLILENAADVVPVRLFVGYREIVQDCVAETPSETQPAIDRTSISFDREHDFNSYDHDSLLVLIESTTNVKTF
jgi:hypothetical protein